MNPYHDFSAPPIEKHGWEAFNQSVGGLGDAINTHFKQQEANRDAIKLLMLKSQIDRDNSIATEKSKQQSEFDMEDKRIARAKQNFPDQFSNPIQPPNQDQGVMSGAINNPVSAPSMFATKIDPMTGKTSQIDNPAYKEYLKPPTAGQETTALYASRLKQSNDVFNNLESYINKLPVVGTKINQLAPNFLKSGNYQSYEQAQRNFLNAVLRRESGAVISPSEFENGRQQYFPQPGDKPEVLLQKKNNRELVMQNFIKSSRGAYVPYEDSTVNKDSSSKNNDPLGIR